MWRCIIEKDLPAAQGLATDEMMISSLLQEKSGPILHLYSYQPCALIGRYQDLESSLRLKRCEELKIAYNRRFTGGGTVLMGPEQLALAFAISLKNGPLPPSIKGVFYTMTEILREGLSQFGLKAEFRPKNDLEIKGKKIAGLSAVIEKKDILLFHTSLLLDFDFELMIEVLNLPPVKMKDKGISCFTERMTTLKREMGRKVKLEEVMEVIKSAFERKLHLKLKADNFTERENREKKRLIKEKYTTQEWLYCVKIPSIKFGRAVRKTKAGLVQVDLTLSRGIIENIFITGDFLPENEKVIGQIESILKWSAAEKEKIKEKLTKVMEKDLIYNLTPSLLAEIITEAKENVSPSC